MKGNSDFDPKKVAECEIGWWKAHNEKDYNEVINQMAAEYMHLFGIRYKIAKKVVLFRIKAAKEHDLAEKDGITKQEADAHWKSARKFAEQHFQMLKDAINDLI
ncbi:MAG: hypothetical protein Q7T34_01980 [Candidatus Parcubacteria bacterium]|nr:hypothetical protein [Candidatus Parcubacteria bacterium]